LRNRKREKRDVDLMDGMDSMDSMDWQRRAVMAEVERDLARAECACLQAALTTARALVSLEIAEKYGVSQGSGTALTGVTSVTEEVAG
jgi:hypothetical protein